MTRYTPLWIISATVALTVLGSVYIVSRHHAPAAPAQVAQAVEPAPPTQAEPLKLQGPPPVLSLDATSVTQTPGNSTPTNLTHNSRQTYTPPRAVNLPLSVSVLGDDEFKLGQPIMFTAVLAGPVVEIQWKVKNRDDKTPVSGLTAHDGGRNASFTGDVGRYTVTVAVGGENGAVDFWDHDFEVVPKERRSTDDVASTPSEAQALTAMEPEEPTHQQAVTDLTTYISNLVNGSVQSPTRNREAVAVGAAYRETANLISTNQYTGADPSADVRKAAALALGQSAAYWTPFFNGVDALIANLRQSGQLQTVGDIGIIYGEIGKVLATAR